MCTNIPVAGVPKIMHKILGLGYLQGGRREEGGSLEPN